MSNDMLAYMGAVTWTTGAGDSHAAGEVCLMLIGQPLSFTPSMRGPKMPETLPGSIRSLSTFVQSEPDGERTHEDVEDDLERVQNG